MLFQAEDGIRDIGVTGVQTCALPIFVASGEGDLVTLASEAGRRGLPHEAVYCASKFGQVGFTRALDHELRERGVRCTSVCPGGVATEFALETGRPQEALEGMMSAQDVADVVRDRKSTRLNS